jgi:AsmA-like C-terminal region
LGFSSPSGVELQDKSAPGSAAPKRRRRWARRTGWIVGVLLVLVGVAAICMRIVIVRAQPILRARVVETLSARFKSRVELGELHVWVANGVHVDGKGLKIFGATDPNPWEPGVQPLLEIGEFRFQTALRNLFREPMRVDTIYVSGLSMNIPPKNDRQQMSNMRRSGGKMKIAVDQFVCVDTKLIINTSKPGKAPLEFDIGDLKMKDIGPGQPLSFRATLINPKPVGNIQSTGVFGPFNEISPRDTAVGGDYSFTDADLGTIKGIGGILSSTGKYSGTLGRIEVEGQTDTPDFQVAVSGHRVPLHTDFHAIVDGADGDTYLDPVKARVLQSSFTARGKIVRTKSPNGHDIELNVVLGNARIEDLLTLGVKTDPPIMTGTVGMKTSLSLPPGPADVANRLRLEGSFDIPKGHFTNEKIQGRIDSLSMRSLGHGAPAKDQSPALVLSDLKGTFKLDKAVLAFSLLHFQVPGTHADMTGLYSLDGNTFDFHGLLRLDAKLSQMTTGWKSILLKPVDPFFHKHGAGAEIPFKISGTRDEPHFGLDLGRKDETPAKKTGTENASE